MASSISPVTPSPYGSAPSIRDGQERVVLAKLIGRYQTVVNDGAPNEGQPPDQLTKLTQQIEDVARQVGQTVIVPSSPQHSTSLTTATGQPSKVNVVT